MGPKKNKKRNDDDDEQLNRKEKNLELIMKKVQIKSKGKTNSYKDLEDQEELMSQKRKQVFDWKLSRQKQKALHQAQQKKQKQLREKQSEQQRAKVLTPVQQKQLQTKVEKQRKQKQNKQKKKQEKKGQRQKQLQEQKIEEQRRKEQEQRQNEQVQKKLKRPHTSGKCIPIFFVVFILSLCVLQYQREIYSRLSKFKIDSEQNYYETFEIDSAVTDKELKEKYKRLVLKYHPDKNPNCSQCEDKFNKIIKAWEVLGNPQKRKHYDSNSGFVTQIKSQSLTLTPQIYQNMVLGSKSLWMIQVYDSTQKYCHYFSQFWQDVVKQYGAYIKFGRIDVWTQSDMLSYLPYRFQVFPSIYFYHKGQVGICSFDFQNPDSSVRRCLQSQFKQTLVKHTNDLDSIQKSHKPSIVFTQKVKMGSTFKIINKKYEEDFNYYLLKGKAQTAEIFGVLPTGQKTIYNLGIKDPQFYAKYERFLQSLIVQKITVCQLILQCQNQPCFILIGKDNKEQMNFTVPKQNIQEAKPVYFIQEEYFRHALDDLKNKTQMFQNYDLGVYQNGHIDLGYLNQATILNAEEGESFQQLHCVYKDRSFLGKIKEAILYLNKIF